MQERRLETEIEVEKTKKKQINQRGHEREDGKGKEKLTIPLAIPSPIEFPTIPYGESIVFTSSSNEMKKERNQKKTEKEAKGDS